MERKTNLKLWKNEKKFNGVQNFLKNKKNQAL